MAIKILAVLFAIVAVRRVIVRYRRGGALTLELVLWTLVFSSIGIVVFIPSTTDRFAHWLGVSSGFNALTFLAVAALFFAVFRLIARVQTIERDLTKLVRAQALASPTRVPAALPPTSAAAPK